MLGVYLAAAELTARGFIVSVTSRNARGVDLLAADTSYRNAWSIQVKTNRKPANFWLLNKSFKDEVGPHHVYLFMNLRGTERADYYVVPSSYVAERGIAGPELRDGGRFYAFYRRDAGDFHENWSTLGTNI